MILARARSWSIWYISLMPSGPASLDGVGRLLVSCTDRPGIVAALSRFLRDRGANILQSDQHTTDPEGGAFFMRTEFRLDGLEAGRGGVRARRSPPRWPSRSAWTGACTTPSRRKRVAILVSRYDHCLAELLWRWRRGELYADIPLVVSNHPDLASEAERFGVHFEHVPVERGAKPEAERAMLELLGGAFDLIVLARYMQILSPTFLEAVRTPIINIHHSFLPAFAGADPYARAHERGVKIIGATAHYVTEELDAGPIIEQDVARVTHREGVDVAGADRRRPRADRAPARRALAPRGPRAAARQPHGRVPLTRYSRLNAAMISRSNASTCSRISDVRPGRVAVEDRLEHLRLVEHRRPEPGHAVEHDVPDAQREHEVALERLDQVRVARALPHEPVDRLVEVHQRVGVGGPLERPDLARASPRRARAGRRPSAGPPARRPAPRARRAPRRCARCRRRRRS